MQARSPDGNRPSPKYARVRIGNATQAGRSFPL
jgi:hypothetical protein